MANRRPLVLVGGRLKELPLADAISAALIDGDLALLGVANTWTAKQTFNAGIALANSQNVELGTGGAGAFGASNGSVAFAAGSAVGAILYLRPNGVSSTTGQVSVDSTGKISLANEQFIAFGSGATLRGTSTGSMVIGANANAGGGLLVLRPNGDTSTTGQVSLNSAGLMSGVAATYTGNVTAANFIGNLNGNAATATTLSTSPTINGTAFNGSANITTALWGASRTITIGSTGKAVNGSANVGWTLVEIGAAARGAITASGLTMATARLLGRTTAAVGAPEELAVDSGLTLSAGALTLARGKNYFINGGLLLWLRGFGGTVGSGFAAQALFADRWINAAIGCTQAVQRVLVTGATTLPDTAAAVMVCNVAGATGSSAAWMGQKIEGVRSIGGKITVSFWASCSLSTGKVGVRVIQDFGSGGSPAAAVETVGGIINVGTAATKKTITITLPSTNNKALGTAGNDHVYVVIDMCGTGYSGAIAGQNAQFGFSEFQVESGGAATNFEARPVAEEQMLCDRYARRVRADARANLSAGETFSVNITWPEMRSAPAIGVATAGNSSPGAALNVVNTNTVGARLDLVSTSTGDSFVLDRIYLIDAEL